MSAPEQNGNEKRKALLLEVEQCVCKDRQKTHGDPEDNFADIAELWAVYKDRPFTSHDVAVMMVLVKVARLKTSLEYKDNWIDIAGYAICGGSLSRLPMLDVPSGVQGQTLPGNPSDYTRYLDETHLKEELLAKSLHGNPK
jgi:hypothetical protein